MNSKNIRYGSRTRKTKDSKPHRFGKKLLKQLAASTLVFLICTPVAKTETGIKKYISKVLVKSTDIEQTKADFYSICLGLEERHPYLKDNAVWTGVMLVSKPEIKEETPPAQETPPTPQEALELVAKASPEEFVYPENVDMRIPLNGEVTSPFGAREHPVLGTDGIHHGMDIAGNFGDSIISCAPGKVLSVKTDDTYGNCLLIQHTEAMKSFYAHCDEIKVIEGEIVDGNTLIATVGSTGISTGPHLHFELRINDEAVNPGDYIALN